MDNLDGKQVVVYVLYIDKIGKKNWKFLSTWRIV